MAHRLLLLGTGGIAGHHVEEFARIPGCTIVACVDQVPGRGAMFAAANKISQSFESLEAAIGWGAFDAAINATPDGVHKATTLALLAQGKHVFCEKPLAPNHADALAMTEAAEAAGVVNMVNLTYRNSPAIEEARRMVQAGEIGALRHVEASYKQSWLVSKSWGDWRIEDKWLWRLSNRHGSTGVLGDVGIHILDFASYGADQDIATLHADLVTFPKAEGDRIGDYVLDANDSVAMTARFKCGALATIVASRYMTGHANDLSLAMHGTKGAIKVKTDGKVSRLSACLGEDIDQQRWRTLALPDVKRNALRFAEALDRGRNGDPSFRRAADMQRLIDAAFESSSSRLPVTIA
ncbi:MULTISPECIES: Gfo/Idh/MocA family oxidoreductase [unclassified Mesorhizobium]|uniref:Gfo/Idh/MocA family protein n=1 Tax=unclassified Mesorhizobium TaxID=325217 RepID=UPI0011282BF5|nr:MULTISPECIES: Gfo/Idh/MocA family oxidoreductase [unclassified Mesorhizobium]TPJ53427.1 Gfo/Idh/MocA family oxidoreductase [Mesorhizobium sp. B2-6-4]TPM97017.1 Gfo/Idh/MocA family oxidoreductase [Mesorhizobium sp. B2-1-5]TPN63115.1 Gfo/Idh/MocA family oxidoreductase [Mesorhizobium sp. B1-1-1]